MCNVLMFLINRDGRKYKKKMQKKVTTRFWWKVSVFGCLRRADKWYITLIEMQGISQKKHDNINNLQVKAWVVWRWMVVGCAGNFANLFGLQILSLPNINSMQIRVRIGGKSNANPFNKKIILCNISMFFEARKKFTIAVKFIN